MAHSKTAKIAAGSSGKQRKRKTGKPASAQPEKQEYTPTPLEAEIWDAQAANKARKLSPKLKIQKDASGSYTVGPNHKDPCTGYVLLMHALGTMDFYFLRGVINQSVNATKNNSGPDEETANFMLAVMQGIEPRDQIKTMLAMQMAATHLATMTCARRLAHADKIEQHDSASNAFNKLQRTFTTQMEALKRYRSTGEQRVVVERVTVQAGGQAIVGNVAGKPALAAGQASPAPLPALAPPSETPLPLPGGGGAHRENGGLPCEQQQNGHEQQRLTHAPFPPLRSKNPKDREAVPVPCDGKRQMQNSRRQKSRLAERDSRNKLPKRAMDARGNR